MVGKKSHRKMNLIKKAQKQKIGDKNLLFREKYTEIPYVSQRKNDHNIYDIGLDCRSEIVQEF